MAAFEIVNVVKWCLMIPVGFMLWFNKNYLIYTMSCKSVQSTVGSLQVSELGFYTLPNYTQLLLKSFKKKR